MVSLEAVAASVSASASKKLWYSAVSSFDAVLCDFDDAVDRPGHWCCAGGAASESSRRLTADEATEATKDFKVPLSFFGNGDNMAATRQV